MDRERLDGTMSQLTEADIKAIGDRYEAEIETADDLAKLDELRVKALGKKGEISGHMKSPGKMDPEERKLQGPLLNALRDRVAMMIADKKDLLNVLKIGLKKRKVYYALLGQLKSTGKLYSWRMNCLLD